MKANASIPLKKLERDFQQHLNLKKIIQKSQPIPIEKLLKKKNKMFGELDSQILPPIDTSTDSKKKRSSSENKTSRNHHQGGDAKSMALPPPS